MTNDGGGIQRRALRAVHARQQPLRHPGLLRPGSPPAQRDKSKEISSNTARCQQRYMFNNFRENVSTGGTCNINRFMLKALPVVGQVGRLKQLSSLHPQRPPGCEQVCREVLGLCRSPSRQPGRGERHGGAVREMLAEALTQSERTCDGSAADK